MTPSTSGVPWPTIVAVAGGILGIVGVALLFLIKLLLKSYQKNAEQKREAIQKEAEQNLQAFQGVTFEKFSALVDSVIQLDRRVGEYFKAYDRLRDKWEEFLREYLAIDGTRSQKVEALLRIVDEMREALREIRPTIDTKIEETITHALAELKLYVRDFLKEKSNA